MQLFSQCVLTRVEMDRADVYLCKGVLLVTHNTWLAFPQSAHTAWVADTQGNVGALCVTHVKRIRPHEKALEKVFSINDEDSAHSTLLRFITNKAVIAKIINCNKNFKSNLLLQGWLVCAEFI